MENRVVRSEKRRKERCIISGLSNRVFDSSIIVVKGDIDGLLEGLC
jgi:hypothetical protein